MESESNVIPFVPITTKEIERTLETSEPTSIEWTENLNPLEYSTMTGFKIISAQDFIQSHPDAARALFNSARTQYDMAVEAMGFLEQVLDKSYDEGPHTADIIDARDPEIWRNKSKNNISP